MTTCIYLKDDDKPFAYNQNYLFCDVCTLHNNPDEQFVIIIDEYKFMSGNEFVINLTEYDVTIREGKIHIHKCNQASIKKLVNQSLGGDWE